jgi:sarcosine oxidase gamma subunit
MTHARGMGRGPAGNPRDELQIGIVNSRAALQLKSWIPGRTSPCIFPPSVAQHCRLLTVASGEWLLVSDTLASDTLRDYARHFHDQGIAAVNGSPGLAAIELEGDGARHVLRSSGRLDLHPDRFPGGVVHAHMAGKAPRLY